MKKEVILFQGKKKISIHAEFLDSSIRLEAPEKEIQISNNELTTYIGGSNNHLLFFKASDTSFYLTIEREFFKNCPNVVVKKEYENFQAIKKKQWLIYTGVFICVCLFIWAAVSSRSILTRTLAHSVPFSIEKKLGDKLFELQKISLKLNENPKALKILDKQINRLRPYLEDEYQDFNFYISKDPNINAFAFPGGSIVLNQGLILSADSFDEILGVMAHELSHVTNRHVMRGIIYNISLFSIVNLLIGDISGIIAVVLENGGSLLSLKFSKDMEIEADKSGVRLMEEAGLNLNGLISFLEKLREEEKKMLEKISLDGEIAEKLAPFFSTHPATEDRINYLSQLVDSRRNFTEDGYADELKELKRIIKESP